MPVTARVGIFGQSFAQALNGPSARGVFNAELARDGITASVVFAAWGGSSALKANARTDQPTWYWWDEDTGTPGPLLIEAINRINAAALKPRQIFWLQGEQDCANGDFDAVAYDGAVKSIIWKLKQACDPASPTSVFAYADIIGRRILGSVQKMREAQLGIIASSSIRHLLDKHDLPLRHEDPLGRFPSDFHFMESGNAVLGFRAAQQVRHFFSESAVFPPAASVLRASATSVSITVPPNTTRPPVPEGFAIRDGSAVYGPSDLSYSWAGDSLTATAPATLSPSAVLLQPYGSLTNIDRARLITDSIGTPLKSLVVPF